MPRVLSFTFLLVFLFVEHEVAQGLMTGFVTGIPDFVELTGVITTARPAQEDFSGPLLQVKGQEVYFLVSRARSLSKGLSEMRLMSSLRSPPWGWRLIGGEDLIVQLLSAATDVPYSVVRLRGQLYLGSQTLHVRKVSFSR